MQGANSLYVMRFLLGAAEAGFFPGVLLYMTYWLPSAYRARMVAIFMVAIRCKLSGPPFGLPVDTGRLDGHEGLALAVHS